MTQPAQQASRWYDTKEAASLLGLSQRKLHQFMEQNHIIWKDTAGNRHAAPGWTKDGLIRADQRKTAIPAPQADIDHWYTVIQLSETGLSVIKQLLDPQYD